MTYSESAEGIEISRRRAIKELADHGITHPDDLDQFDAEMGVREIYQASAVLAWLGY